MPERYKRTFAPEAELTDEELLDTGAEPRNQDDPSLGAEEKTWKKRYGDLRSHTQRQINDLTAELNSVKEQLKSSTANNFDLPTSEADVEAWAKKYPQIAAIVETIARTNAKKVEENIDGRLKKIQEREDQTTKREAQIELERIHPDFFTDIKDNEDFHAWLATKPKRTQDSIYENDTDYEWAAETVTLFKLQTGFGAPKRQERKANAADAAREVGGRNRPAPPSGGQGRVWKESEILTLNPVEYAKYEEEIDKAIAEGRMEYDIEAAR